MQACRGIYGYAGELDMLFLLFPIYYVKVEGVWLDIWTFGADSYEAS